MCGRWRSATSDPTKIRSPRWRSTIPGSTAVANRLAPMRWIWICDSKVVRADFVQPAEVGVARAGDQQLDVAELIGGPVHEPLDRVGVRDIERQRDGLAARGSDLVDQLLALVDTPGTQRDREAVGGKLDRPSRRRFRMTRRRRSRACGRGVVRTGASSGPPPVMGRWANPRTLLEWTRTALASSTSYPRIRLNNSVSATRASIRARCAPRQKWAPLPKLTSFEPISRPMRYSSASSNTRSSRLAEPGSSNRTSPSGIVVS